MNTSTTTEDVLHVGSHTFASRLIVGTGKYADHESMREALARQRHRVHHRRRPPRATYRRGRQQPARLHRHQPLHDPAEHGRLLHAPTMPSASPASAARFLLGLENPGADWVKLEVLARQANAAARPDRHARSDRATRRRRLPSSLLLDRRPDHRPPAESRPAPRASCRPAARSAPARASSTRTTSASAWSISRKAIPTIR